MDISKTSNMFVAIAECRCRAGDDMEDVARELAVACCAVMQEGIGPVDEGGIMAEFLRLIRNAPLPPVDYSRMQHKL